jgi:hypothetical protein
MENSLQNDSGFKLDISADMTRLNTAIQTNEVQPSSLINPIQDIPLPDQRSFEFNEVATLPRSISNNIQNDAPLPQSFYTNPSAVPNLPKSTYNNFQPSIALPESVILKPTAEKIQPYSEPHASALNDIKVSVKIKPEDALNKANQVGKNLDKVRLDLESLAGEMRNPDSRLSSRDNYEEKITIPAENLIFENRKNRMTQHPDWK